jgi:Tol biopolymer transport system component
MVFSLVAAACSGGTSIPTPPPSAGSTPGLSPIARQGQIAFASDRDGNRKIYVINADGMDLRRLTDDPADDGLPTWSPDGPKIAFASDRDGNFGI